MKNMKQKTSRNIGYGQKSDGKGFGSGNYATRAQGSENPVPKGKAQKVSIPK